MGPEPDKNSEMMSTGQPMGLDASLLVGWIMILGACVQWAVIVIKRLPLPRPGAAHHGLPWARLTENVKLLSHPWRPGLSRPERLLVSPKPMIVRPV